MDLTLPLPTVLSHNFGRLPGCIDSHIPQRQTARCQFQDMSATLKEARRWPQEHRAGIAKV